MGLILDLPTLCPSFLDKWQILERNQINKLVPPSVQPSLLRALQVAVQRRLALLHPGLHKGVWSWVLFTSGKYKSCLPTANTTTSSLGSTKGVWAWVWVLYPSGNSGWSASGYSPIWLSHSLWRFQIICKQPLHIDISTKLFVFSCASVTESLSSAWLTSPVPRKKLCAGRIYFNPITTSIFERI